ncbi:MAG: amylo-alpha-1,6-glucosidase [Rhodospirillales bacterium]
MRTDPVRILGGDGTGIDPADPPEWLVGNGLGGFASGTVTGLITRRYHGLLIAALPVPIGRMVMLDGVTDTAIRADGSRVLLGARQVADKDQVAELGPLAEFRLELGLPVWRFALDGLVLERRLVMVHGQNTTFVFWKIVDGDESIRLELRPFTHVRPLDGRVNDPSRRTYTVLSRGQRHELAAGDDLPTVRLQIKGEEPFLVLDGGERRELFYAWESRRGYDCRGGVWSPGTLHVTLAPDRDAVLTISTESWETALALPPAEAAGHERARRKDLIGAAPPPLQEGPAAELVLAADSFIVTPPRREPRALAAGDDPFRTVIAGYHWFTDWGRDTMISLEGLTLVTGRHAEARGILRNFAVHIRDGLIPNLFPEHDSEGVYNTADATLWFFHALDRYLEVTGDRGLLRELLPKLTDIVRHHLAGTRFGIGIDPADGLLRQGEEGYQLTWMDAKVDDWVVTPRRGKAVEINALWYNALCLLASWASEEGIKADGLPLTEIADKVHRSFNARFWSEEHGHLFDVVDGERGNDASLRPNQVFAISLPHPVLEPTRWQPVLDAVQRFLLTPVGLRSLAPQEPDYQPRYWGDLRARDAAYHQGTVWGWLIGPYVDAWLKLHPADKTAAESLFAGFWAHLDEGCIGSISEIFDAERPFAPRGCIAQAWSVAEVLRSWRRCAGGPAG